jgi:ADP-ribosyl-[dinitrogen reductase] hydrolase
LACGDALGAPIEFMDSVTVKRRYGKVTDMMAIGSWEAGEWSDDTGLALCLAEGILEDPEDPMEAVGRHLLGWSESAKDFAAIIRTVLNRYREVEDWLEASRSVPQVLAGRANGNGSLMRILPVALAYSDEHQMLCSSARLSAMTHWDSEAEACCAIYCLWVRELLAGIEVHAAWGHALKRARRAAKEGPVCQGTPGPENLPKEFWLRWNELSTKRYEDLQPSGFAGHSVECLEAAAWCCLHAETAEQAILDAINLAGESDTIGAVAGGAAGARWGLEQLPVRWLEQLHERNEIEEVGQRLEKLRNRHDRG